MKLRLYPLFLISKKLYIFEFPPIFKKRKEKYFMTIDCFFIHKGLTVIVVFKNFPTFFRKNSDFFFFFLIKFLNI